MNTLFIAVLLMSVTSALLVLCLSFLHPVTRKCFNAAWHYRIYMLTVLFLLVPFGAVGGSFLASIPAAADQKLPKVPVIINEMITVPQNNIIPEQESRQPQDNLPATNPVSTVPTIPTVPTESSPITVKMILSYLPFVWLIGALAFIIWQGIRLVRFKRKITQTSLEIEDMAELSILKNLMAEMKIKGRLHLCSNNMVKTPMLIGLFKTYLILPEIEMSDRELAVILKHELIHFKRRDLWIKSLTLLANGVHWFNPAAYRLTKNIDTFCELSCDEQIVSDMNPEERQFYGETILNVLCRVVTQYSGIHATLAESKKGIKRRLIHIMNVKKNSKRIAFLSFIAAALLCLAGCAAASVMNLNGEKNELPEDFVLLDIPEAMGLLEKTRAEINQRLGSETEHFKEHPQVGKYTMIAVNIYETEDNLPVDIVLSYLMDDDTGQLREVGYSFEYKDLEEAQHIWEWVYSQKKVLEEYYGHACEHSAEEKCPISASISEDDLNSEEKRTDQWNVVAERRNKPDDIIYYSYSVSIGTSRIYVSLNTATFYNTITDWKKYENKKADKIKDSVLFELPNMIQYLNQTLEEVTKMLGDEADNFEAIAPKVTRNSKYTMVSEAYMFGDLSLRIDFNYEPYKTYLLTDLSPATNSVSYQAVAKADADAMEILGTIDYLFHYNTEEERKQILSWISEQREVLAEYFGRPCDFKSSPDNRGGRWMLDVKESVGKDHQIAYCFFGTEDGGNEIRVSLNTYEEGLR